MKFVSRFAVAMLCGAMLLVSGCTTGDIKYWLKESRTELDAPSSPDAILLIGYLEKQDKSDKFGVNIERVKPDPDTFKGKFWARKYEDHGTVIFTEVLTTGQYQITEFIKDTPGMVTYYDVHKDPYFARTFTKPGIYNIGAYKLKTIYPEHMIGKVKFEIEPAKGPGERKLLETVLPFAKNEYWKKMIERRLQELPK